MIVVHEGLPGSGKSYEAVSRQLIPALQAGRPVVAYIEGLNFERIAEVADLPPERVQQLLTALQRDDIRPVPHRLSNGDEDRKRPPRQPLLEHRVENALYILDEAQNFWPGGLAKLDPELTEFITEHRHHGRDIVLMGQDMRDVHPTWRRRIDMRMVFLKLTSVGFGKSYSVTTFRHKGRDKYDQLGVEVHKYDPKYFGTYKSHVDVTTNTADKKDRRGTIFNTAYFKYFVPVALVLGLWGGFSAWRFFHPAPAPVKVLAMDPVRQHMADASAPAAKVAAAAASAASAPVKDTRSAPERLFAGYSEKGYRPRLAGMLSRAGQIEGVVEWIDAGSHVFERLTIAQLRAMHVTVEPDGSGFLLASLGAWSELVTMWPVESDSRISDDRLQTIKPRAEAVPDSREARPPVAGFGYTPPPPGMPATSILTPDGGYQAPPNTLGDSTRGAALPKL